MAEERMHKMVNGKRVDLTPEEEEKVKAEWAANRAKSAQKKAEKAAKIKQVHKKRESARAKLKQLGLDDEEIEALTMKAPQITEDA